MHRLYIHVPQWRSPTWLRAHLGALQPAAGPLTQQLDSMEAGIKAEPLTGCPRASPPACSEPTSRPEDPVKVRPPHAPQCQWVPLCAQAVKLHLGAAEARKRAQRYLLVPSVGRTLMPVVTHVVQKVQEGQSFT